MKQTPYVASLYDWMFDQFEDLEFWIFIIWSEIFKKDDLENLM